VDIATAIERLARALAEADLPRLRRPGRDVRRTMKEIATAIHPLRLPADLSAFWSQVDVLSIPLCPFPELARPDFALDCWQDNERNYRLSPTVLFPIAYQSHCYTYIELAGESGPGGVILNSAEGDFEITHPGLPQYLDQLATTIELGDFTRERRPDGSEWYLLDEDQRWEEVASVRLAASLPLPGHGHRRSIGLSPVDWPEHWLRASGLNEHRRTARGADTTIAQLLAVAATGVEARGTVHASRRSSAGSAAGYRLTIDDGTATVDVWCPQSVSAYLMAGDPLEFDLVVRPRPSGPPDTDGLRRQIEDSARSGRMDAAAEYGRELYARLFETPATAEATAVRPLQ
jgi:hypothetical protein